ncbi:MAG: permease [Anaerolineae bacterium]
MRPVAHHWRKLALRADATPLADRLQTFVTIFLSIFIEAVPFLLAGSLVSGFISVFVDQQLLERFVPRQPILAALMGASLGLIFPVCECGVVPVTRRLYQKGLPLSMGVAFLMAAPVINPVVFASTYAAFGFGPIFWSRIGFSFLIAAIIGFIFSFAKPPEILSTEQHEDDHCHHPPGAASRSQLLWQALAAGGDDFLDMARYLITGSILAATMQTVIPQSTLLTLGAGPVASVLVMITLAFVLSVCSTVDAFLALAFVNSFTPASVLAFLVFGPMVDIKSSLMFLGVFRRRTVMYLILLPLMLTMLITIYLNLNVKW